MIMISFICALSLVFYRKLKSFGPKTIFFKKRKTDKRTINMSKGLYKFKNHEKEGNYREWMACKICFELFDVLLGVLQAIELLQRLVQDLVHSYVFFFCM